MISLGQNGSLSLFCLLELHTVVMKAIHLDGVNFFNTRLLGTSVRI